MNYSSVLHPYMSKHCLTVVFVILTAYALDIVYSSQ